MDNIYKMKTANDDEDGIGHNLFFLAKFTGWTGPKI